MNGEETLLGGIHYYTRNRKDFLFSEETRMIQQKAQGHAQSKLQRN